MTQDQHSTDMPIIKKDIPHAIRKRPRQKYFEWINGPYDPVRGESALWVAVITQAMMDALNRATNSEAAYYKYEATIWLTENSKDFYIVCALAGLDPDYVRRRAKRALVSPRPWRAEAGKGQRYQERKEYRKRKLEEKSTEEMPAPVSNMVAGPWAIAY